MLKNGFSKSLFLVALMLVLAPTVMGQTVTGTLQGRVVDAQGSAIPGATVKAKSDETGIDRSTVTNEDGYYQMAFMPLGSYTVTAEMKGFKSVVRKNIDVRLNQATVVDIKLEVSGIEETVTITAEAPAIDTTSGEIKTSFDSQVITDRPLATRNFLSLAEIVPGFQTNAVSGQNNPTLSSGSSINFAGTGTRGATFQTDGVNNDDSSENQNRQGVNIATIKEFQVITNSYTAEFGRGYGAVVLVQTKSGTNQFHGEGYFFTQNSALNANSFFRNAAGRDASGRPIAPVPPSRRHQGGGVISGPIFKERLFFLASVDSTRSGGSLGYTADILLPNERTPAPSVTDPASRAFIQSIIDRFPNVTPNNPSAGPRAFTTVRRFNFPDEDYSGRVDWKLRQASTLTFRYQLSHQLRDSDDVIRGEQAKQNNRQQNFGFTATHVFSNRTVGEFRFAVGRRRTIVDIKDGNDTPVVRFSGTLNASIIGNAGAFPIHRFQTDFQYVYNHSTLWGNRQRIKMGADIRRQHLNDLADNFSRGFYTFSTVGGFDAYGNFLRGFVTTFTKGYGPFGLGNRLAEVNSYFQDDFKVTPSFTLNLGVRYEYVREPKEVNNLIDYGFKDDKNNVEPRFGFAYSPGITDGWLAKLTGGPGRFSIRGGYGIFHGRLFQSVFSQAGATLRFNPPNAALLSFFNSFNVADPTNGFVFRPGPPTARVSLALTNPDLHLPYTQQWNLTIERQLPARTSISVGYNGNRGIGLPFFDWDNRPDFPARVPDHPFIPASLRGVLIDTVNPNNSAGAAGGPPLAPNEISLSVPRVNERRPDPRYSNVVIVSNAAWTYYHSLQLKVDKRLSRGLAFNLAYTLGKAIDSGSEATSIGIDANAAVNKANTARSLRALSLFDTRHRLTFNYTYMLPFFKEQRSLPGYILGGWQISGTTAFASGNPFSVFLGYDYNADGIGFDRPFIVDPSILGRSIDNPRPDSSGSQTSLSQLPASAFFPNVTTPVAQRPFAPGAGNIGSLGRNTFFLHGANNWDIGLYKNFLISEGRKLAFRAELYNAFNRPQFGVPGQTAIATTLGRISTQRNGPRTLQFALRYIF